MQQEQEAAMTERLYTVPEVAKQLGVHADTVHRYLTRGDLRGVFLGRKAGWRVSASDVARFLSLRVNPAWARRNSQGKVDGERADDAGNAAPD